MAKAVDDVNRRAVQLQLRMNFTISSPKWWPRLALLSICTLAIASSAWGQMSARDSLRAAVEHYSPAQASAGKQEAADAFFQFEGSVLDRDLATRDPSLYRTVEAEWMRPLAAMAR